MTTNTLAPAKPLTCQKHLFSLPESLHYLNCAYMSPLSKRVEAAGLEGVRRKSVPTRIPPEAFFSESNQARALFAQLVNTAASRIAIIPAVSYGVATVIANLELKPGQKVVLLHDQFPSNVYAWRRLQKKGVVLKTVQPAETGQRAKVWNERVLEAIDADTAVVTMPHIHWTDGSRFDLEAIGARAREVGAALIIDGTQSIGAFPFDIEQLKPDALIVAGYKTLMGPYGVGFAYYGSRFDQGVPLEDSWITRKGSEDFSRLVAYQDDYAAGMVRYDVGERSNPILLPMLIAALQDLLERSPAGVQAYCQKLTAPYLQTVQELGYSLEDASWRASHLFGIRLPKTVSLEGLKQKLAEKQVAVSVRGTAVRVSPNVYNDEADLEALLEVLQEARGKAIED
jgi:selenocysteine lyase/cysteine desulfurase